VKSFLRNTVSLILAAIVLIATSGFTVFHHSCRTAQTSEFSLIIPDFSCKHFLEEEDKTLPACCATKETKDEENRGTDKCCDTEIFLVKLDITFKVIDFDQKTNFCSIDLPEENTFDTEIAHTELSHIIECNGLPPPLAGKDLHIYLHQLNIPFPSV
jgi:hypothetical protein